MGINQFKPRSEFGKFLDSIGKNQEWVKSISGLDKDTISRMCNPGANPQIEKRLKLISALNKQGYKVGMSDFWDV